MSGKTVYEIRELPPYQHVLTGQRYRELLYRLSSAAVWVSGLYFIVRLGLILSAPQTWKIWLMLLVEWIFARLSRNDQLLTVSAGKGPQSNPRKRLRLHGNSSDLPLVDVLIPCCGEPLDVILDTVHAACSLDYPSSRYRVLLLDDGGSSTLQTAITTLQSSSYPHLSYHTRGHHPGHIFAKSANLNYALFSLPSQSPYTKKAEYCAVLDADCIPAPDYLRATLPHLLTNPTAALLTTRQYYYNLPLPTATSPSTTGNTTGNRGGNDPLSQSRIYFYACTNTELDTLSTAIDAGSGALFRRDIIVDLGGYPTFSFSEDWQLSLILKSKGWGIIQVEELLQLGLVPGSLGGHVRQRDRWNIGHAQQVNILLPGGSAKGQSRGVEGRVRWGIAWDGVRIVLGLVGSVVGFWAVPLLLLLGGDGGVVPVVKGGWGRVQVVLATVHMALTWGHAWVQVAHTGWRVRLFAHLENSWLAGSHLLAIFRFCLVSNKPRGSFVTGNTANAKVNSGNTSSLVKKFQVDRCIILPVFLFLVTLAAGAFSIFRFVRSEMGIPGFLRTVGWPPLLHICYLSLSNLWVPVAYLLNPPKWPERDSRLTRTEKGIRFPRVDVQRGLMQSSREGSVITVVVPFVLAALLILAILS